METFHLNLHKSWFDMVLAKIKKEEYRELPDYWKARFKKIKECGVDNITFSNGYRKDLSYSDYIIKKAKEDMDLF